MPVAQFLSQGLPGKDVSQTAAQGVGEKEWEDRISCSLPRLLAGLGANLPVGQRHQFLATCASSKGRSQYGSCLLQSKRERAPVEKLESIFPFYKHISEVTSRQYWPILFDRKESPSPADTQ